MRTHLAGALRHPEIAAVSCLAWQLCQVTVHANPTGGTYAPGSATISTVGSQTTIHTSANAYINWNSFNINAGETTTFVQPSSASVVWNNINSANGVSQILGGLNANGYVILQNAAGFYVGGSAAINTGGLIMTTASAPAPDLSGGGAWTFNAPPPSAKIINLGQINITGGGSVFLIASDIENDGTGTISAPSGKIGLYAGEQVLVSMSPVGLGLSAQVTLPQGSVNNQGQLIADGGAIAAQAQTVNQNGLMQANSMQSVNGVIELVANDSLTLGTGSKISAQGDPTLNPSAGGSVTLQAGNTFSDETGSSINVSGGALGGNAGQVVISAPQIDPLQSSITGSAVSGFAGGELTINPNDITLDGDYATTLNTLIGGGISQINLNANNSIEVSTPWTLPAGNAISSLSLTAGSSVTLEVGSGLSVPGGSIYIHAPTINQNGTLQANSMQGINGVIELVASDYLGLGANSDIEANGDNTSASPSPGGFVVLQAGNTFSDTAGSQINVAGSAANGGQNGMVEVFGNNLTDATSLQSQINGISAAQFSSRNFLMVNPFDLAISYDSTATATTSPNLNVNDLAAYSQIDLHALDNIEVSAPWSLNDASRPATLSLTAGNNIIIDDNAAIQAGNDWRLNLTAGAGLAPNTLPTPGNDGIYLNYNSDNSQGGAAAFIQTQNGDINLWAANEVQVGAGGSPSLPGDQVGYSGITTLNGGNITVKTVYGDVNTGENPYGYTGFKAAAPHYGVSSGQGTQLGGISTAAGGNVTITAGGNVISYLPTQVDAGLTMVEGGTGAYGPDPGNVTITAGGNIYGHYVLADGVGAITAGGNVGSSETANLINFSSSQLFSLSLISGGWNVNAPNDNIYLQEVRNPNGVYNDVPPKTAEFLFDYSSTAYVDLSAVGVVLQGNKFLPRLGGDAVPVIYPPSLTISAGSGGVELDANITLYPSPGQNLNIATIDGGNFIAPENLGNPITLLMSDSSSTHWSSGNPGIFSDNTSGTPPELNNPNPAVINISGSMEYLDLVTSKETQITVGGDMIACGFAGENLHASDVTSISVGGSIMNLESDSSIILPAGIPNLPSDIVPPYLANSWDTIFSVGLNPNSQNLVNLATIPAGTLLTVEAALNSASFVAVQLPPADANTPSGWANYVFAQAHLFPNVQGVTTGTGANSVTRTTSSGALQYFFYNPTTGQLGYEGPLAQNLATELASPITVLLLGANGLPITTTINNVTYFATTQVNWLPTAENSLITSTLYTASQPTLPVGDFQIGYSIGGPGQFDVTANSLSLGSAYGILSLGVDAVYPGIDGANRNQNLGPETSSGAAVNVTVTGDINMSSSTIASVDGGNVTVTSTSASGSIDLGAGTLFPDSGYLGYGIFTGGAGDVSVVAAGDVDINSSRIATYDGGNIFIESLYGGVDVGTGGDTFISIYNTFYDQATRTGNFYQEDVYGSGIVAETLLPPGRGVPFPANAASLPGNITVETPQGNITANLGGITQEALDGSIAGGPTINLSAGTFPSGTPGTPGYSPGYVGSIDLGKSGVIGGTVSASANGNINGLIISRQSSTITAAQNVGVTVLSGGAADVTGGGTISGIIVGVGGASVSGASVSAQVLSQNASVNGGAAQSTLGSTASATSASQSAANQSDTQSKQQLANNNDESDDDKKKKKKGQLLQHVKRVTVILPAKS